MKSIVYLQFSGNAKEALEFYKKALNADKVKYSTFALMPNPGMSEEDKNMIMDAYIEFGDNVIMLSDVPSFMRQATGEISVGNNMLISIIEGNKKTNEKLFSALSEGGTVIMPISEVPWSKCFGMLVDKFGITWKFNSDARSFIDNLK